MKQYNQAPLPFMGQKRKFIKSFTNILAGLPDDAIYIDLFGGSGLLSHVTKRNKSNATVIYNDFDNYRYRIHNIPATNALLARIRPLLAHLPRKERIPEEVRQQVLALIREADARGFVDYITLSGSFLFSGRYATDLDDMEHEGFYNKITANDYDATGYLDGLTITSTDYRNLFNEYKDDPRAIFLVDPPYLSTDVSTYTMTWSLSDYLDVLTILRGHRYIYFTSNKSQIIELCEWMGRNADMGNPFVNATRTELQTKLNYTAGYTDIMLHSL